MFICCRASHRPWQKRRSGPSACCRRRGVGGFLADQLAGIAFLDVAAALSSVPVTAWLMAIAATLVSFLAVARYDALFHGLLGTGIGARRASFTGAASMALAQIFCYGLITGTLARWRALPELPFRDALRMTNYVPFSFIAALVVISACAAYAAGLEIGETSGFIPWIAFSVVTLTILLSVLPSNALPFRLPSLRLSLRVFTLTAVDTAFAAIALWVLLPARAQPEPTLFVAAFLLAPTGWFLTGAPGGMGPFQLCNIALLPAAPQAEYLAAILAFRIVYYALPACLAICIVVRLKIPDGAPLTRLANPDTRRAEAGFVGLPGHRMARIENCWLVSARTQQSLVIIGDPVCGRPAFATEIGEPTADAAKKSLWSVLHKVSGQSALAARLAGWSVVEVGEEVWVSRSDWQPDGRRYRQFRRKIHKARDANVEKTSTGDLPQDEMERVSDAWALAHGGEHGFSMGISSVTMSLVRGVIWRGGMVTSWPS